jgi:hypothetical protein
MLGELVVIIFTLIGTALTCARQRATRVPPGRRLKGDAGEGVISTAIAVLIVAFLGAAMYLVFQNLLESSGSKANDQVNQIGDAGGGG